ncbi:GrpE protein homolog 2, mitochondrial-like protein [Drosera capensis]
MSLVRVLSRASRNLLLRCRNSSLLATPPPPSQQHLFPVILSNQFHSLSEPFNKVIELSLLENILHSPVALQRYRFSSSASPEASEKENEQSNVKNKEANAEANGSSAEAEAEAADGDDKDSEPNKGSELEGDFDDLSKDDLVKLVLEKEETLKIKQQEIAAMKDKVLRSYAEMENVMERTRRESENSKKFAIQGFAKSLLDVADNLGRALSVVKESYAKIDTSNDSTGAAPLLKALVEGVEMTEKNLMGVFKKFGVEKYDPTNEQFDPNRHNAVFQVPDNSKAPGTVAVVLKSGYVLHDRVIRPAEVGVTHAVEAEQGSES